MDDRRFDNWARTWRVLVPDDACLVVLLGSVARRSWGRSGAACLT